jgi:hypothetical protein
MAKAKTQKAAAKVKRSVSLSEESDRRLMVAGAMEQLSASEVVEMMISKLLCGYVGSMRGPGLRAGVATPAVPTDRPIEGQGVNLSEQVQA